MHTIKGTGADLVPFLCENISYEKPADIMAIRRIANQRFITCERFAVYEFEELRWAALKHVYKKEIKKSMKESIAFFAVPVAICILCVILSAFIRPVLVTGKSMENTYSDGQILFATDLLRGRIAKNDIVIAKPDNYGRMLIKRVIATGGDTLEIRDHKVYVNNREISENYLKEPMETESMEKITLQENEFFLMGDNRNHSCDSRELGTVTDKEILYKVF